MMKLLILALMEVWPSEMLEFVIDIFRASLWYRVWC
jgi:hypothetical protein